MAVLEVLVMEPSQLAAELAAEDAAVAAAADPAAAAASVPAAQAGHQLTQVEVRAVENAAPADRAVMGEAGAAANRRPDRVLGSGIQRSQTYDEDGA